MGAAMPSGEIGALSVVEADRDQRHARAMFNGPGPGFIAALDAIAPDADVGEAIRAVFDAAAEAERDGLTRQGFRQTARAEAVAQRDAATASLEALRRWQATRSGGLGAFRVEDVAAQRGHAIVPCRADVDRMVAEVEAEADRLHVLVAALEGRGRPASTFRMLADRVAPVYTALAGKEPTVTQRTDTSKNYSPGPFVAFLREAIRLTTGETPDEAALLTIAAEIARAQSGK